MRMRLWSLATLGVTVACSGGGDKGGTTPPPPPPPTVASVVVTLANGALTVGQTTTATAVARDASGGTISGRTTTWTSSATGVATVDANGTVTAVAAGTANITATVDNVSGSASLTVAPVPVASVTVTLNAAALSVGQTTQATAVTRDAANNVLTGRNVTWSSSNTGVATVSLSGLVTAVSEGTATISATAEGRTGQAALVVLPDRATQTTISISAITANGAPADLTRVAGEIRLELDLTTPLGFGGTLIVSIGGAEFVRTPVAASLTANRVEGTTNALVRVTQDVNTADYTVTAVTAEQISVAPRKTNGTFDLIARLEVPIGGQTYTAQATRSMTLANVNTFLGVQRIQGQSATVSGRTWEGGELTLRPVHLNYQGPTIDDIKLVIGNAPATFGGYASATQVVSVTRSGANPFANAIRYDRMTLPGQSPVGGTTTWIDSYREGAATIDPQSAPVPANGVCADLNRDGFADAALPQGGLGVRPGCTVFQRTPSLLAKLSEQPAPRAIDAIFNYDHVKPVPLGGFWEMPRRHTGAQLPALNGRGAWCCSGNQLSASFDLRASALIDYGELDDFGSGIDRSQVPGLYVGTQSTVNGIRIPANAVAPGALLPLTPNGQWSYALGVFSDRVGNEAEVWLATTSTNPLTTGGVVDPTPGDLSPAALRISTGGGTGAYTGMLDGTWFKSTMSPHAISGTMTGASAGYASNAFGLLIGYRESFTATPYPLVVQPGLSVFDWGPEIVAGTGGSTAAASFPIASVLTPGFGPGPVEGWYDLFFCGAPQHGEMPTGLAGAGPNTPLLTQYSKLPAGYCRSLTVGLDMSAPSTTNNSTPPANVGTGDASALSSTVSDNLAAGQSVVGAEYRGFANGAFDAAYVYVPFAWQNFTSATPSTQATAAHNAVAPWAMYLTNGAGAPPATGFPATHLYYQGFDRAGNASSRTAVAATVPAAPNAPWGNIQDVNLQASGSDACTGALAPCGSRPTSTTYTYRVRSLVNAAPFLYVAVMAITAAKQVRALCTTNQFTVTQVGAVYEYLYVCTMNWLLWAQAVTGAYQIAAFGVDNRGLALKYGVFLTMALWASQSTFVY